ncbi:TetR/AcrR family transcriptional regulator [Neobacillus cucumis]|uniref:TetR/AcrR family transcriptional regulator n=1 Tax=Neobacillus cucumis TaxID=1740721 RepID=UPI0028535B4E|nr:TetR/AcrR family transcriptional regulator [Neobacillus cucumis]MDR4947009.1 TetR/AcrR family transcriptional regulator [Neobacillus cucumis]
MSNNLQRNSSFPHILDTTEQLIKEKGCRHTTLQDIIERSGLSKGAIYHYVSGKDELFGLVLKSKMEQMNNSFNGVVAEAAPKDADLPIQFIAQGMAVQTEGHDVTSKIMTYLLGQIDNPKVGSILSELYESSLNTAKSWIEIGQKAGAIPEEIDAEKMASLFMVFTYGLRVQNIIPKNSGPRVQVEDIFKLILRSLK